MFRKQKHEANPFSKNSKEQDERAFENCDYMIFAINSKNELELPDEKFLQEAFRVITTYSFPMNTNPLMADILKDLSAAEWEELDSNEYRFILKKIKAIDPKLSIIPVPKSLYQFHYLVTQLSDSHTFAPQFKYGVKEDKRADSAFAPKYSDINQYSFNYHTNPDVLNIYIKTNQLFVKEWIRLFGNSVPEISYSFLVRLIDDLYNQFIQMMSDAYEHKAWVSAFVQKYCKEVENYIFSSNKTVNELTRLFLQTLVCWEWSTKDNNGYYTLYRGGELDISQEHCCRSWSDGALGGALYDAQSGMAFAYSAPTLRSSSDAQLMALHINKKNYRLRNQLKKDHTTFIPPLHNIGRVSGVGEHHHARTTLASDFSYEDSIKNYGGKILVLKDNEHLLGSLPKQKHYSSVLSFLKENTEVIKPAAIFNVLINGLPPGPTILYLSALFPTKHRSHDDCLKSTSFVSLFSCFRQKANKKIQLLMAKDDIELYRQRQRKN
ncbi:MAG: hypothetical protein ACYCQI_10430 [Gammaproteobacteria bacterium]